MSARDRQPELIEVVCPHCETRLRVRSTLAGKQGTCPRCRSQVKIPPLELATRAEFSDELPLPQEEETSNDYQLAMPLPHGTTDELPPLPPTIAPSYQAEGGYLERMGDVRQEKVSRLPRWPLVTGVWNYPWTADVWPRWIWLVVGQFAVAIIPCIVLLVIENSSGYMGVAAAFFVLPEIWLVLWSCGFACSLALMVFEETAGGIEPPSGWPDPHWHEWVSAFMYVSYVAFMVAAMGYSGGLLVGGDRQACYLGMAIAEFVLFPVCLMSVYEQNNLALLFSWPVLRSLFRLPLSWLTFYASTAVLWGGWLAATWGVAQESLLLAAVGHALVAASGVLIYARLLGRLGRLISTGRGGRKQRVRSQPTAIPTSETAPLPAEESPGPQA